MDKSLPVSLVMSRPLKFLTELPKHNYVGYKAAVAAGYGPTYAKLNVKKIHEVAEKELAGIVKRYPKTYPEKVKHFGGITLEEIQEEVAKVGLQNVNLVSFFHSIFSLSAFCF